MGKITLRTASLRPHDKNNRSLFDCRLWGNPAHLDFLTTSLRNKYAEDKLHILTVKRNAGSYTYDGVETGGERVANEIEESIEELARDGTEIKKISVIGYSLGGVIARYAIGLLYSKGVFERIEPVVCVLLPASCSV